MGSLLFRGLMNDQLEVRLRVNVPFEAISFPLVLNFSFTWLTIRGTRAFNTGVLRRAVWEGEGIDASGECLESLSPAFA
jgi:hypothetical protein